MAKKCRDMDVLMPLISKGDENEGGDEGANEAKAEYVKKEYYARPYVSPYATENDVKGLTTKNSR
jgi:hypothetical protein